MYRTAVFGKERQRRGVVQRVHPLSVFVGRRTHHKVHLAIAGDDSQGVASLGLLFSWTYIVTVPSPDRRLLSCHCHSSVPVTFMSLSQPQTVTVPATSVAV